MADNDTMAQDGEKPFGSNEEKAIISLAFDMPEFFSQVGQFLEFKFFKKAHHQFVYGIIQQQYQKHGVIPTREVVEDLALKMLKAEDDDLDPVLETIHRKSNFREIPIIKDMLLEWVRNKAYGELYSDQAHQAWVRKDYETLENLFEKAKRITDITNTGMDFFTNIDKLFVRDEKEKLTTGFPALDVYLNSGGPGRGEVFIWMAPTGRGKSILLVHAGRVSVEKDLKVLHITLENSTHDTMLRYMGAFTDEIIADRDNRKEDIEQKLQKLYNSTSGRLIIAEWPPEEITVDTVAQYIDMLKRTKNWKPDVVIIDYLDLMLSRNQSDNKDEYLRQGKTATQLCGLAKTQNVLVLSATQTNRDGLNGDAELIGLNKTAQSFGKMMPIDYCVTINQTEEEHNMDIPQFRLWIAKNRKGPSLKQVRIRVNYKTMRCTQQDFV